MQAFVRWALLALMVTSVESTFASSAWAQAAPAKKPVAGRELAPGIVVAIDDVHQQQQAISFHDVVELIAVDDKFEWARHATFQRDIWTLEFSFKPVRFIEVDIPLPSGKMQRKLIWYMIYKVRNSGRQFQPVDEPTVPEGKGVAAKPEIKVVDAPIRFLPEFMLESRDQSKAYRDRLIPVAIPEIAKRERPPKKLHDSISIGGSGPSGEILSTDGDVWGVATWESVDPFTDFFSVYVTGLTNAYRRTDKQSADGAYVFKAGDPILTGRILEQKTLKINFWRPSDHIEENEEEIRLGMPGELDYEWIYR